MNTVFVSPRERQRFQFAPLFFSVLATWQAAVFSENVLHDLHCLPEMIQEEVSEEVFRNQSVKKRRVLMNMFGKLMFLLALLLLAPFFGFWIVALFGACLVLLPVGALFFSLVRPERTVVLSGGTPRF